jgi:L-lactate dehydrogenase
LAHIRLTTYIEGKGATWFGVDAGMARIAQAIASDENAVIMCSVPIQGTEEIPNVSLFIPRIIAANGIEKSIYPELNEEERKKFIESAEVLCEAIEKI